MNETERMKELVKKLNEAAKAYYQEDREIVEASFRRLVDAGVYPENLYG